MENFKMFFCQKKSLKISGRQSLTGRIILNAYPVIWLLPESNIRTMQLPSSVGQDRIILLPGKEITKVRNTKHYDKIYRKATAITPNRELQPDEYFNETDHLIYCSKCNTPRQCRHELQGKVLIPSIRCKCQQEIF